MPFLKKEILFNFLMKLDGSSKKTGHGNNLKIAIVFSEYNSSIGDILLKNTVSGLIDQGVDKKSIRTIRVPGALEIPLAAMKASQLDFDAIIALGIVLKGETSHYEIVSEQSHRALMDISLNYGIPVVFGIICAFTPKQALERADNKKLAKGREFAETAVEMANLMKKL